MNIEVWYNVGWEDDAGNPAPHGSACKESADGSSLCGHRPSFLMRFGQDGDPVHGEYNLVWGAPIGLPDETDPLLVCEQMWRSMNVVDGTELPTKLHVRSMSMNDVVVVNDRAFIARAIGFEDVTDQFMAVAS